MLPSHDALVAELSELIAIPSVSADPAHAADLARAADWVAGRIRSTGGEVEIEEREGRPLVLGEVRASRSGAPVVLARAPAPEKDDRLTDDAGAPIAVAPRPATPAPPRSARPDEMMHVAGYKVPERAAVPTPPARLAPPMTAAAIT